MNRRAARTTILPAGYLMAIVALAACSGVAGDSAGDAEPTPSPTRSAAASPSDSDAPAIDCLTEPSTWVGRGAEATPGTHPTPAPVPADFAPVAVYRCSLPGIDGATDDDHAMVTRYEGDLDPLLTALALPDDPTGETACTLELELVPALWLEDADGELIPVRWPRDACDKTKPGARAAVDGLVAVATTEVEVDWP